MKHILLLALLTFSLFSLASDKNVLVGEWEQYDTGISHKYTYFKLNNDMSGVFATSRSPDINNIDYFTSKDVVLKDGIIEIGFNDAPDYSAKLILSGYRLTASDSGLVTGMLYYYSKNDDKLKLFNTIFIRLLRVEEKPFNSLVTDLHNELRDAKNV